MALPRGIHRTPDKTEDDDQQPSVDGGGGGGSSNKEVIEDRAAPIGRSDRAPDSISGVLCHLIAPVLPPLLPVLV